MSDRPRWCPDCEVLGSGSDLCWMCGRPLEPPSDRDRGVSRMKDLLGADSTMAVEDPEETRHNAR